MQYVIINIKHGLTPKPSGNSVFFFLWLQLQFEEMVWSGLKGVYAAEVFRTNKVWLLTLCQPHFKLSSLMTIPRGSGHLYECNTLVHTVCNVSGCAPEWKVAFISQGQRFCCAEQHSQWQVFWFWDCGRTQDMLLYIIYQWREEHPNYCSLFKLWKHWKIGKGFNPWKHIIIFF